MPRQGPLSQANEIYRKEGMGMKRKHLSSSKLWIGILSVVVFSFVTGEWVFAQQVKEVRIGALYTLSGALAQSGVRQKNVTEMAVEEINAKGGIKALGGAKLTVVYGDSQGKPDIAVSETERLIQNEKVSVMMDVAPSVCTLAATSVAERLKTPFLATVSFADHITERGYKYTFQQEPKVLEVARQQIIFVDYLNKLLGGKLKKAALLYEDTDYGQTGARGRRTFLKEAGYPIVADVSFPSRTPNYDPILMKLKAGDPDFVLDASYLSDAILIAKTAKKMDLLNIPWIASGTKTEAAYWEVMGNEDPGAFCVSMWGPDISPEANAINERYKAKYGGNLDGVIILTYQGTWVVKEALEKAGSADRDAIRNALATIEIKPGPTLFMPYQNIKFNEKGLNTGGGFTFIQIQGGKAVTVFPERFAAKKVDLSMFTKFKK